MSKYTITITEEVPNTEITGIAKMIRKAPDNFYIDVLKLDTNKNLVAEIAGLVAAS